MNVTEGKKKGAKSVFTESLEHPLQTSAYLTPWITKQVHTLGEPDHLQGIAIYR